MKFTEQQELRAETDLPEDFFSRLVTVTAAAQAIGVSPSTVHNWISRGYVDQYGDRHWLMGFHIDGIRLVLPLDAFRADAEVQRAARGGLRKVTM